MPNDERTPNAPAFARLRRGRRMTRKRQSRTDLQRRKLRFVRGSNDECRMSNDEGMTKSECQNLMRRARFLFEHSGLVRHSSFVLSDSDSFASIGVIRG